MIVDGETRIVDKDHIDDALEITDEDWAAWRAEADAWTEAHTEIRPLENAIFTYSPCYDGDDCPQDYTCTWSFEDGGLKYAYVEDRQKWGRKGLDTFEVTYPEYKSEVCPDLNRPEHTKIYELVHVEDTDKDRKTNLEGYIKDLTWRLHDGVKSYLEELYPNEPDKGWCGGFAFGDNTPEEDAAWKRICAEPKRTGLNKEIWDKVLKQVNEYRSEYDREKYEVYDYECFNKLLIAYYFLATAKDSITVREKVKA